MNLIAFGCSHTFGQALDNNSSPSDLAYPQILANKLSLPCINLSKCASSNKLIAMNVCQASIQKDDIVIVAFSYLDRHTIFNCDSDWKKVTTITPSQTQYSSFYKYHTDSDGRITTGMYIDLIWTYLKSIGCRFIISYMSFREDISQYCKVKDSIVLGISDFNRLYGPYDRAQDGMHYGPQCHYSYANYLIKLAIFAELTNTKTVVS